MLKRWTKEARYANYVKQFREKQAKMRAKGLEMWDTMYSKEEFIEAYDAEKNYRLDIGKKPGNITRDLISEQAYETSYKQARKLTQALIERDMLPEEDRQKGALKIMRELREGKLQIPKKLLDEMVSKYYHENIVNVSDRIDPKTRKVIPASQILAMEIAKEFFGS